MQPANATFPPDVIKSSYHWSDRFSAPPSRLLPCLPFAPLVFGLLVALIKSELCCKTNPGGLRRMNG
jgi:hypothetical protein